MGLIWSTIPTVPAITSSTSSLEEQNLQIALLEDDEEIDVQRKKTIQSELTKFKEELDKKREARRDALTSLGKRMAELREEKDKEKMERERLEKELEKLKNINENERTNGNDISDNRVRQLEMELENVKEERDRLAKELEDLKRTTMTDERLESVKFEEVEGLERQVKALKEVAGISGEMLRIRELQVNELTAKLTAIEETGQAYEKEVDNLRRLRKLYEERARAVTLSHQMELEREKTRVVASEAKLVLAEQKVASLEEQKTELKQRIITLDKALDEAKAEISDLRIELAGKREDLYNATSQMSIINQLFSQVLSGPDGLERVTRVLEEHHDLVNHLTAKGKINDLASTLLGLADKEEEGHVPTEEEQDIAANLGKVWRLLVELLGHHARPVTGTVGTDSSSPNSCYKSIDTPKGPKLVISVSQTFLRLKDLILEKNCLVKEVGRLKDLNSTLETRLVEQEGRLSVVATELHKTWDVVNKLKVQHKHLHTNEQVLRYELAQKRLMLNEMKKELENCRENWELAREKNSKTEEDWRLLRKEFAARKQINSAESGYEESPGDSQDEEEWSAKEDVETVDKNLSKEKESDGVSSSSPVQQELISKELLNNEVVENEMNLTEQKEGDKLSDEEHKIISEVSSANDKITNEVLCHDTNEQCQKSDQPSSSSVGGGDSVGESVDVPKEKTAEERLKAREDRLKRLEEQCKGLFNKMNQTSQRSDLISNRLVELHEHYGEEGRLRKQHRNDNVCTEQTTSTTSEQTNDNLTSTNINEETNSTSSECLPKPSPDLDPDPKT